MHHVEGLQSLDSGMRRPMTLQSSRAVASCARLLRMLQHCIIHLGTTLQQYRGHDRVSMTCGKRPTGACCAIRACRACQHPRHRKKAQLGLPKASHPNELSPVASRRYAHCFVWLGVWLEKALNESLLHHCRRSIC